ncbi:Cytochrome P450 monooxygenase paxP [Beauveria bassiana]|nr:Cytochrome P450 monooxygenase paxP [Beauveria bassiana]
MHNQTKLQVVTPVLQTLFASPTSILTTLFSCLLIFWLLSTKTTRPFYNVYGNRHFDAPIVGPSNALLARWHFFRHGPALIRQGYTQHRDSFFKVSGHDILVVPPKYLADLAVLPPEKLSVNAAIVELFQRLPAITTVIVDHSLQARMVASRLTPSLGAHVPRLQAQLRRHLPNELLATTSERWVSVPALALVRRLVHRGTAAQFVAELADDEAWLATAIAYSENGFAHSLLLRVFPDWAKPVAALCLPTGWSVGAALRRARRQLVPLIRERRRRETADVDYVRPDDFLQHLMDGGGADDNDDNITVQRLMVVYLGAGPSTMIAIVQILLDLCAHPEYIEPLRQEAIQVLRGSGGYSRQALADMKRLDSFMRETQRLSSPTGLGLHAIVREPVTLHDGVILPEGAHIQMAVHEIGMDPDRVPNPAKFDGMRQYNNRKRPGQGNCYQYTTTSENNLYFGYGKVSCPGRFFADQNIKMIVSNILIRYRLRYAGGAIGRPKNTTLYDVVIPDLSTLIEFKLREDASEYNF